MEDLLFTQKQIIDALEQTYTNFKKDGSDRKSSDYIKRRLDTLDQYRQDFQANHIKLCSYGDKSGDYFTNNIFEQTKERYEHIRKGIRDYKAKPSDVKPAAGPRTPQPGTSRFNIPGGANREEQIDRRANPPPQPSEFRSQGVSSKTEEMIRTQSSLFRALQRTILETEIDELTDKCDFGKNSNKIVREKHYFKPSNNYTCNDIAQAKGSKNFTSSKNTCALCKSPNHRIYFCPQFTQMHVQQKYETINKLKVCENCLNKHDGKVCISNNRCKECDGKHNTILHEAIALGNSSMTSDSRTNKIKYGHSTQANVSLQTNTPEILLATAMVKVQAKDGSYYHLRALIDQGSQISLITENAAQPEQNKIKFETDQEMRKPLPVSAAVQKQENSIIKELLMYNSRLTKATNILAWIYRFISNSRKSSRETRNYLTLNEINNSKCKIIKETQQEEFLQEIADLRKSNNISTKSKIAMLNPYLDKDGLLRTGGRLKNAHISFDMRHPILIPKNTRLSELIIDHCHQMTYHGGARLTLAYMRQSYWLVGGISATKKRVSRCVKCRKQNPIKKHQLMGDLPPSRVNPSRPFQHTGVDYTGHVFIKANKGRGIKTTKGYVAVFICMATKAVHLELVSDLTTSSFLAALHRMSARRGVPSDMYSDQGTTFIGANKVLQQEYREITNTFDDQFKKELAKMGIRWHFNAPSWPSAGGLWEAAVKSLKYHLKRVVGEQRLTFEEYSTLLAQLEACLNQRPLCPLTEDIDSLDCLTPAHFLTNGPTLALYNTESDLRTRWHLTQKVFGDVWKRWRAEYLTQLTARSKWRQTENNIKLNDIVSIQDANLPAGKWALGRVTELHPGDDGLVRVVSLKTKNGIMKRPVVKLSPLPVAQEETADPPCVKQDSQTDDQNKNTTSSRPCRGSNFITSLLMTFMFIMTLITTTQGAYNTTTLDSNQSLYFDKISEMYLVRGEWRLVVYYNMTPYWEGTKAINKYIAFLKTTCLQIKDVAQCESIILQLEHEYKELQYYDYILMNKHSGVRQRRGLINGVGNIANALFGVLDNNFAEKYEKDIELLKRNDNHLALLWKNQTSVIEGEFNLLKRTENIMTDQHNIINQRLQNIELRMEGYVETVSTLPLISDFTLTAMTANNIITQLKKMQDTLLDTLTNIYNGQLNLHLLSPDQLRHEIGIIASQIPKDLATPIDTVDMPKIYHLLKIHARMSTNNLIFEIKIPLIIRDLYEVHHVIPIPHFINKHDSAHILPISNYLAINLKKNALLTIRENDLKECLHQDPYTILCELKTPVYHISDDEIMCIKDQNTTQCKVIREPCESRLIELQPINNYLYLCCDSCQLKLLCNDQITSLALSRAGVLAVSHGCVIKYQEYTIYTHEQGRSDFTLTADISIPLMAPINHVINITIPLPKAYTDTTDQTELGLDPSNHRDQIQHLERQIKEMKDTIPLYGDAPTRDVHHYVVIYSILAIMFVTVVVVAVIIIRRSYLGAAETRASSPAVAARSTSVAEWAADAAATSSEAAAADWIPQPASRTRATIEDSEVKCKRVSDTTNRYTQPIVHFKKYYHDLTL